MIMKKIASVLLVFCLCAGFAFAQTADDLIFSFTKKENGKIMTKNDDGSRYANFTISGIKSDEQAANLVAGFKKSPFVIDFIIKDNVSATERTAYFLVKKEAKFESLRDLLKINGIAYVKLDGKIISVASLKSQRERRDEKLKDTQKP